MREGTFLSLFHSWGTWSRSQQPEFTCAKPGSLLLLGITWAMLDYSLQRFAQVIMAVARAHSPSSCMCPSFAQPPAPDRGQELPVWKDNVQEMPWKRFVWDHIPAGWFPSVLQQDFWNGGFNLMHWPIRQVPTKATLQSLAELYLENLPQLCHVWSWVMRPPPRKSKDFRAFLMRSIWPYKHAWDHLQWTSIQRPISNMSLPREGHRKGLSGLWCLLRNCF